MTEKETELKKTTNVVVAQASDKEQVKDNIVIDENGKTRFS